MKSFPEHMVIGYGEVGRAIHSIFIKSAEVIIVSKTIGSKPSILPREPVNPEVMHVCTPYNKTFIRDVKEYQKQYTPRYTIIHSTVPVGTSRKLKAVHSPIRGIHPNLEAGIQKFVKFIGGKDASAVADVFRRAGMRVMLFDESETTEAMKLFDTEYYRMCIEFSHRVKRYCDRKNLSYHEVYTLANSTYNEGYQELGHPEFVRPVLQPILRPIGGHCIIPNSKLLKESE